VDWEETGNASYPCSPSCFSDLPALTLVTSAEPVFDDAVRRSLSVYGDIVDMEGAIVAAACVERGMPCTLIKGISDNAGQNGREALHKNIVRISEQLADLVIDRLEQTESAFP
jgi:nucleoside phosphorylase